MHSAITMTDEERDDMLESKIPMRFASYSEDGFPHVVPVWHAYMDGKLYFDTDKESVKVRNIKETGRGAGVVDKGSDYSELRGVLVQGECSVIEDEETREEILMHNLDKYFGGEIPEFVQQRNESVERVSVELSLDHITTWDFRKVFSGG